MKILLINPPTNNIISSEVPSLVKSNVGIFPPLGLMYIEAYIKKHTRHKICILDTVAQKLNYKQIENYIVENKPEIVGITAHTHNLVDVILTSDLVKRISPNIHVSLGGAHVNDFPDDSIKLKSVDSIILNEGEVTFCELANSIESKSDLSRIRGLYYKKDSVIIRNEIRDLIADLDSIPFPERKINELNRYYYILANKMPFTTMISSRGCPYACSFCNTPKGIYRMRTPENIVNEMQECQKMGIKDIHFVDDTFNVDQKRTLKICEEIIKREIKVSWSFRGRIDKINEEMLGMLKKSGCYSMHLGVECSTNEGLNLLNKGITIEKIKETFKLTRKYGINTMAYFMIGCPNEKSEEDINKTIRFAIELDPDFALFNIFTPYPSTPIYEMALKDKVIKTDKWKEFVANPSKNFELSVWDKYLTKDVLYAMQKSAYQKFYLRPLFIKRILISTVNIGILFNRIRAGWKIILDLLGI